MTESTQTSLAARDVVRMAQIVAMALISGVVLVALAVVLMANPFGGAGEKPGAGEADTPAERTAPSVPVLPVVGVVVAIAAAGASFVLPAVVQKSSAAGGASGRANQNPFVTRTIVALAPLEGAAMVNLVLEFVEPTGIGVGVAAVVLLLMFAHFPTVSRYEAFVKQLREQAELEQR